MRGMYKERDYVHWAFGFLLCNIVMMLVIIINQEESDGGG